MLHVLPLRTMKLTSRWEVESGLSFPSTKVAVSGCCDLDVGNGLQNLNSHGTESNACIWLQRVTDPD